MKYTVEAIEPIKIYKFENKIRTSTNCSVASKTVVAITYKRVGGDINSASCILGTRVASLTCRI